ncbi:MAG TPA: hypothetical protein VKI45_11470 [Allosphingosinicella sp.]|nr:hypothetical protein [Allosphingosinicella sp.]
MLHCVILGATGARLHPVPKNPDLNKSLGGDCLAAAAWPRTVNHDAQVISDWQQDFSCLHEFLFMSQNRLG